MKTQAMLDLSSVATTFEKLNIAYSTVDTVIDRTFKDMVSRAPGKIASSVTTVYSIKKSEIKYSKIKKKSAGHISIHGQSLSSLEFRYAGRLLTPLHFSMTPKNRPVNKKYKIKAKIKKQQKAFTPPKGGGVFLAPASKSLTEIPWMRKSSDRFDIAPIKTLSLPQMVDNKDVRIEIGKEVGELLETRYTHHLKQHFNRCL